MKQFADAVNLHWTTANNTPLTRNSFDFRLLDGRVLQTLKCGGHLEGGQIMDVYRKTPGYYSRCVKQQVVVNSKEDCHCSSRVVWTRDNMIMAVIRHLQTTG